MTRPPKQKSSKKAEEGHLEAYAALPPEASFSSSLDPSPKVKKPIFKTLPLREPSPIPSTSYVDPHTSQELQPRTDLPYCYFVSISIGDHRRRELVMELYFLITEQAKFPFRKIKMIIINYLVIFIILIKLVYTHLFIILSIINEKLLIVNCIY